jgi:hypothetical protein
MDGRRVTMGATLRVLLTLTLLVSASLVLGTAADASACTGAAPTATAYLPNVTKTLGGSGGWDTPILVQNVAADPIALELSFFRFADGSLVACTRVDAVAPGGTFIDDPVADVALPDDTQFAVVVRAYGGPIATVVNEQRGSGASLVSASYVGALRGDTRVFLPNITRRYFGYDVPFIAQNIGAATANVTAAFTSFDQTQHVSVQLTIGPGRSKAVDPNFTAGLIDGTQYSVVLTSDQPIAVIANAENPTGAPVAYAYTGLASGSRQLWAPYVTKGQPGFGGSSPIVIQNVGTTPSRPQVTFYRRDGPVSVYTGVAGWFGPALQPGESWVADPRFTPPTQPGFGPPLDLPPGSYAVNVLAVPPQASTPGSTPPGDLAALVIPTGDSSAMAYAATPDNRIAMASYLPNITRNLGGTDGWTTIIALLGALSAGSGPADGASLSFYRAGDGTFITRYQLNLGGSFTAIVDPRDIPDLPDGGYSVVVNGLHGNLVAVVLQVAFSGGDAAMAYEGFAYDQFPRAF